MVVALLMVVLLLAASVAIDAGRFESDRRFLQNATDAAALAGALEFKQALVRGETTTQAEADAKARALEVLHEHYATDPTATPPPDPEDPPVYNAGCGTAPVCMTSGILVNPPEEPGTVRVAINNDVPFTFGQVASLIGGKHNLQTVPAKSRAGPSPYGIGPLPVAAREWIQPYGPRNPPSSSCTYDSQHPEFTSVFSTAATSCLGSVTVSGGRADASLQVPGIPVELLGNGADPCSDPDCGNNPVSFDGFVALDIRDFSTSTSQKFYNGITPSTNAQTLDQTEAAYFCSGYPGPSFPPITTPPDPGDEVAALFGASAGIAINGNGTGTGLSNCFGPGDLIQVLVYDGIVKQIPDFNLQWPGSNKLGEIALQPTGTNATPGSFAVTKNPALSGSVSLSTLVDANDPSNPLGNGTIATPLSYSPNPATPSGGNGTSVAIGSITTADATPGIYAALIKGTANAYSNVVHYLPLSINVGGITDDFQVTGPSPQGCTVAVNAGDPITCSFKVVKVAGRSFSGPVHLTLEQLDGTFLQDMGSVNANGSASVTIATGSLSQGDHTYVVRATGTSSCATAPCPTETHLFPFTITVAPQSAPGNGAYVDIVGYAVMEICNPFSPSGGPVPANAVCVDPSRPWAPNSVWAQALTPVLSSLDDPAFDIIAEIRLVPWDYQPGP